jgi:LysR family transcriptional activator of glutamate synthase operon
MTIEQFRYFASIVENGTFSITAEKLNISQSSVSKQIRMLEWELGYELFRRNCRQVKLTEIGEKLYPSIKSILEKIDSVMRDARNFNNRKSAIKLVCPTLIAHYGITRTLQLFEELNPGIQIHFKEMHEKEIIELLSSGECDLAILREEALPKDTWQTYKLITDALALFVHERHPYAKLGYVTPEMLRNETFMFMPKYTYEHQMCMRLCKEHGFIPSVLSCASIETVLNSVKLNKCSALLMKKNSEVFQLENIKVIALNPPCVSTIVAVCGTGGRPPPPPPPPPATTKAGCGE